MAYWNLLSATLLLYFLPCIPLGDIKNQNTRLLVNGALFLGLMSHAVLVYVSTFSQGVDLNFSNALLIISWVTVFLYWLINFHAAHKGFQFLTLVPALVIVTMNPLLNGHHYLSDSYSFAALIHIVVALLGYSLLAFGAIFSIFLLFIETNLRNKLSSGTLFSSDSSILTLESHLFAIYWVGFFLLTITMVTGIFFTERLFGTPLMINHKLIFSVLAWLIYGSLLLARAIFGWRGKKAINFSLMAFIFLFLSYLGSKFVLEILLP